MLLFCAFIPHYVIFPLKRGDPSEDWKQREELCIYFLGKKAMNVSTDRKHAAKPELMWSSITSENNADMKQGAEQK